MGVTGQLLSSRRELVGAPGPGEGVETTVVRDGCAVDNKARTVASVPLAEELGGSPMDNEAAGTLTVPDDSRTVLA